MNENIDKRGDYTGYPLYNHNRDLVGHAFIKYKDEFVPRVYLRLRNGTALWDSFFSYSDRGEYCSFFSGKVPRMSHHLVYNVKYSRAEGYDGVGFDINDCVSVGLFNYCKPDSKQDFVYRTYFSLRRNLVGIKLLIDVDQPYIYVLCDFFKKTKNKV